MPKRLPSFKKIHTIAFDFDGVFTNNKVWIDQEGRELVACDRADGLAFDLIRSFRKKEKWDVDLFILSKETNPVVLARARKLKLDCQHSIDNKLSFMENYLREKFPSSSNPFAGLIYLGNDLNDLPLMRRAGYSVAPKDAHPLVKKVASIVLDKKGGEGFIRSFIERLLCLNKVNKLTKGEIDELISYC